ncbi:hypothetical protein COCNU_scaffold006501G000010 [Cocos nucifera]|nr:hypothetical protein [Cocos nucifera]
MSFETSHFIGSWGSSKPTFFDSAPLAEKAVAQKAQEDLRAKVCHLQERINEVEHLVEEKAADIESLQDALREEEFASDGLKAALALEEERRKEVENRIVELKIQMAKSISEAMTRAMEVFKTSPEMQNLNVEFGQEAFIKGFELCEGRIARRFSKLDLSFLEEEEDDVEVGPSNAVVNLSLDEFASGPSESTAEVLKLVRKPEATESDPTPSFEIEIFE